MIAEFDACDNTFVKLTGIVAVNIKSKHEKKKKMSDRITKVNGNTLRNNE